MLIILLFVICLGAFSFFWSRIETKVEAIQIVKEHYLPKERLESFVSRVSKEGKFKLIGWDIKPTEEKHTFVVSYTLNRLIKRASRLGPLKDTGLK